MAILYKLSTTKLKLKIKNHFIYKQIFLLFTKPRINKKFEMVSKFLLKKILFLINLSFVIKIE